MKQPIIWKAGRWELWVDGLNGELTRLSVDGMPVLQSPQRTFDFKADGKWQCDQYGVDFVQAKSEENWLELTFAAGDEYNPHPIPDTDARAGGLKPRRRFSAKLRWAYDPQEGALRKTVAIYYLDAASRASGTAPRFEGFSFSMGPLFLGTPGDCEMAMPTSVRPETLARPRIPYAQAAVEPFSCGSAPDGDPGLFVLHNRVSHTVLSSWLETVETCYETRSLGFGGGPHLYFYEKYENLLVEDPDVCSHAQVLYCINGTVQDAMHRYAGYIAHVAPPLTARPDWLRNAVFMEVDTEYMGGFRELAGRLPQLKAMGINALYLLPINVGAYAIEAHERINPALGTEEELIAMVRRAHELGMHVLLDLLIVILTRNSRLVREHPEYFVRDAQGRPLPHEAWGNVSTDYGSQAFQEYIVEFAQHCVRDWQVDGFRVDAASYKIPMWCALDRPPHATSLGAYPLLEKVSAAIKQIHPDAVLLNEIAGPAFYHVCDISHNFGFVYCLMGEKARKMGYTLRDYRQYLSDGQACLPVGVRRVFYTRNHDTAWFYRFDGYNDEFFCFEAIHAFIDGIPLIFSGQKGRPQWAGPDEKWAAFYRKLFSTRERYPVLLEGQCLYEAVEASDDQVFCVLRKRGDASAIVVVSGCAQPLSIKLRLRDPALAPSVSGTARDVWTEGCSSVVREGEMELRLPPYGIQIWMLEK